MTMPHLMNCAHAESGWCLNCVANLEKQLAEAKDAAETWKNTAGNEQHSAVRLAQQLIVAEQKLDELLAALKDAHRALRMLDGYVGSALANDICAAIASVEKKP